jgi:hypothetical protein
MLRALGDFSDLRPASAVDFLAVAVGAERMKLVISTETECPADLLGRPDSTAGVAPQAALADSRVADTATRGSRVQARKYLFEVLSQFRQLLGKLVQRRLGGRDATCPRGVGSGIPFLAQF